MYAELGGQNVRILADEVYILTWLAILSLTLLSFITQPRMGSISYNTESNKAVGINRLQVTSEMGCFDFLTAESQSVGQGMEHIVSKSYTF